MTKRKPNNGKKSRKAARVKTLRTNKINEGIKNINTNQALLNNLKLNIDKDFKSSVLSNIRVNNLYTFDSEYNAPINEELTRNKKGSIANRENDWDPIITKNIDKNTKCSINYEKNYEPIYSENSLEFITRDIYIQSNEIDSNPISTRTRGKSKTQNNNPLISNILLDERNYMDDELIPTIDSRKQIYTNFTQTICEIEENKVPLYYLGRMNIICKYCGALSYELEKPIISVYYNCCSKGKVHLDPIKKEPDCIKDLLVNNQIESKKFKELIRRYNSALSFASMSHQGGSVKGSGVYCYKIHGQVYHYYSDMEPSSGIKAKFGQLYIFDASEANRERCRENPNCDPVVMEMLDSKLREINPYSSAYKMLHEVEKEEIRKSLLTGEAAKSVSMVMVKPTAEIKNRYNIPQYNDVAVVFVSEDGSPPFERHIQIYPRFQSRGLDSLQLTNNNQEIINSNNPSNLRTIRIIDRNLDPMTYPIFFSNGDPGWEPDIKLLNSTGSRKTVTMLQYYRYRLAIRKAFNILLYGGKLTQQYIVDKFASIEGYRLNYMRNNQKDLRIDLYSGLMDYLNNRANKENLKTGKMIILPASFTGGPRSMDRNYQDAMAMIQKLGSPDLFITYTCNPRCKEIEEGLYNNQKYEDRPDLVARVFNLKLKELISDLTKKEIFGPVSGYVYVIEFQKRGLPHAHILLILRNDFKIRDSTIIDKIVCAELPDNEIYPRLFATVSKSMIHGPCGLLNSKSSCNIDGICSKKYPKPFTEHTIQNNNGYPVYRRRNDGRYISIIKNGKELKIDNRWVVPYNKYLTLKYEVPYNKYLTLKYDSHINVEICSSIKSIKYLFKYVYKGHDCANIEINETSKNTGILDWDETKSYLDSRYVSAPEAMWRINAFPIHYQSFRIEKLIVHLENQQSVTFEDGAELNAINKAANMDTTLTGWFRLNSLDLNANNYLYTEISDKYIWDNKLKKWKSRTRKGKGVISRMYTVSPKDRERYYLRILLLNVKGVKSYTEMYTFNGILYNSFYDVAKARKLVSDDNEWIYCMAEASLTKMPRELRQLLCTLCIFCNITDASYLWDEYKDDLISDYINESRTINESINMALLDIEKCLNEHGKNNSYYKLPSPINLFLDCELKEDYYENYKNLENEDELHDMINNLNSRQKEAFDSIINGIENNRATYIFITGPGGSGKTYVYNVISAWMIRNKYDFFSCSFTGISANLLINGRTIHSLFGLPLKLDETSTSNIKANSPAALSLKKSKLFIIDEVTMVSKYCIKTIDRLLKDIMNNEYPFGGKSILVGGDFMQTLPVIPHSGKLQLIDSIIKKSILWDAFKTVNLDLNMRLIDQTSEFSDWIIKVGSGQMHESNSDSIKIPRYLITKGDIISEVFGTYIYHLDPELENKVILTPLNEDCHLLNNKILDRMDGESRIYLSVDEIEVDEEVFNNRILYPTEFLNNYNPSGFPTHKIELKVGSIIMLLRNLNTNKGLCNGTRLKIEKLMDYFIMANIITGKRSGNSVLIPRVELVETNMNMPFMLKRRQFPVRLSFVMTINKSQGQSFDSVGLYLPNPCFAHGQLYVALSRARSEKKYKVFINKTNTQGIIKGIHYTRNIVYKEVL